MMALILFIFSEQGEHHWSDMAYLES